MSIKVIEDMEPLEVMKAAMEGKRVAWFNAVHTHPRWAEWVGAVTLTALAQAVDGGCKIAIIDGSQTELTEEWWKRFTWEFFNQYGGLSVDDYGKEILSTDPAEAATCRAVAKSPIYPWFGGKCPVPGNVEVEAILRMDNKPMIKHAGGLKWEHRIDCTDGGEHRPHFGDIIAFRITGMVL